MCPLAPDEKHVMLHPAIGPVGREESAGGGKGEEGGRVSSKRRCKQKQDSKGRGERRLQGGGNF